MTIEDIARDFHDAYARVAPEFHGNVSDESDFIPWAETEESDKRFLTAIFADMIARGVILPGRV